MLTPTMSACRRSYKRTSDIYHMLQSFLVFACLLAACTSYAQDIIIKDVNIIPMTSNTVLKNKSVLISQGKIKRIGDYKQMSHAASVTVVDGSNKFLMPGLADMHVHLPVAEAVDTMLLMQAAAGVTHIRVMNSKMPQTDLMKKLKKDKKAIAPNVYYSFLVNRNMKYSEAQFDSVMKVVKKDGYDFIKLFSLADEATFDNLMRSAQKHKIIVCGHYPMYQQAGKWTTMDINKLISSGFKSVEHLNGYDRLENDAQLVAAAKQSREKGVFNCPTLDYFVMAYDLQYPDAYKNRITYQRLPDQIIQRWEQKYASDLQRAGGKDSVLAAKEKYLPVFARQQKILKTLADNGGLLLLGADAGNTFQASGFNVYEEMQQWSDAGIDNYTILRSATIVPAMFFNDASKWGTVEAGKDGDLIILGSNPLNDIRNIATVETTIINGKVYRKEELLKKLL